MSKNSRNEQSQISQEPKDSSTKFVITSGQSTAIIASTLIGAGVLTLPRSATETAHQSAWITTLIAGFIAFLIMWVVTKLGLRFPGKTVVEYAGYLFGAERVKVIGQIIAYLISFVFILVWLALALIDLRLFGEVIIAAVLPETPLEVLIGTMLIAVLFYLFVELEVIARFNQLILPIILIPVLFVAALSLENFSLTNILPIVVLDLPTLFKTTVDSLMAYQGFTIMILFMAFTQRENNVRASFGGIALPTLSYGLIVFASTGVFGFEELQHLTWPTLDLLKSTDFSFIVLERIESLFVTVWVAAVFTTVGNLFYAACFAMAQLLPTRKEDKARKWIAVGILPILYWLAMLPKDVFELFTWIKYVGYGGFVAFALIILLYLVAIITKKGKGTSRHHDRQQKKGEKTSP